jgi:formylglycine-generating enzyme required for sulfatase activity
MRLIRHQLTGLILSFFIVTLANSAIDSGVDVITMRNGDIHQGTVAHEYFSIETAHGTLSVPYGLMAELSLGDKAAPDQLVTRLGDNFRGKVAETAVTVLRAVETPLPLSIADIADISFARRPVMMPERQVADAVETTQGDRFFARIMPDDVAVAEIDPARPVNSRDIYMIDFAVLMDGDEHVNQVTFNDGAKIQRETVATVYRVETQYGQTLQIAVEHLSTLAFNAAEHNALPDFYHRRPQSLSVIRDRLVDGSFAPEVVVLKGGSFMRGDPQGDDDERPPRPITLKPFAIGVTEVTFEEYDRFCDDTGRERTDDGDWGRSQRPVINVSWNDAVAYTEWLSRKSRQRYRLPTDAEWEYAARASTGTRFWWGDEAGEVRANCEGCGSLWDGEQTARVGRFPPNGFGLYDTAGNVFEWVHDCYDSSFADAPADGSALDKPGCGKRVIRGGAWSFPATEIRSANRWRDFPTRHSDDTGFRIVRELR